MMYKYLNFFNKKGEYSNFSYDENLDKWTGRIDFGVISEGIAEDYQIYILEEVFDTNNNYFDYTKPQVDLSYGSIPNPTKINAFFDSKTNLDDIFIYSFNLGSTENELLKIYSCDYEFDFDPNHTISGSEISKIGIKKTSLIDNTPIQINIGFIPSDENSFSTTLFLKDSSGHIFAEILVYGEGEEEDERLRDLLQSMGCDLMPSDSLIFDSSDVNEEDPNWRLINSKRKELLLEYSNIFPFIGSYKALINIIKFFGYQNLRMKEYWLNIDTTSVFYGKFKQIDINDVFTESANFSNSGLIPSKVYKKTNKFGLYYDITVESGDFDDDGLPIAKEVFDFSPQEILIKIYALKKKLQNYFLPVNAKIVDIIGEAVYFAKYDINIWSDQYRIDSVSLGLKPEYTVLPSTVGYIEDLRPIMYFGAPVGTDMTMGGLTNLLTWQIGLSQNQIDVSDPILHKIQTYRIIFEVPFGTNPITIDTIIKINPDTGQKIYEPFEVVDLIIENINNNSFLKNNYTVYQEEGNSGILRIVQKTALGDGRLFVTWFSNSTTVPTNQFSIPSPVGGTAYSINLSASATGSFGLNGAPISYFSNAFLGYFDKSNVPVYELNDDEDIPVGCPIVLRNDTFNIDWNSANVTYNQIDTINPDTKRPYYSKFNFSFQSGFPISSYPKQFTYSWLNLGYYGYYEIEWVIIKEQDEMPAFRFSKRGDAAKLNSVPVILPYVGFYRVELYMWDVYNNKSFILTDDVIEVKMKDSDFIGWYQYRELEYNLDTKRYPVQKLNSNLTEDAKQKYSVNNSLTWDEYASSWELPLHPNEEIEMFDINYNSIDTIEFYKTITNPINNPLVDRFPYNFNLITNLPKWDDFYHLWWDGTGTSITQFKIRDFSENYFIIFASKGNEVRDLHSVNCSYIQGPTDSTYATYPNGNIGDILVSNDNRKVYRYSKIDSTNNKWKITNEIVDSFYVSNLSGTQKEKALAIVEKLNTYLYNDNVDHPVLKDFIYYYNEEYDSNNNPIPVINAVSKNYERNKRHLLRYSGAVGSTSAYNTLNFGYQGDIPVSFEIYSVNQNSPTGTIKITGMDIAYPIGATNLNDLYNELNGSNVDVIKDYVYNLVIANPGMTDPNIPSLNQYPVKIQAVSKKFDSTEKIEIKYGGGIIGTTYGRSLIKNPTWDQVRILKYNQELPLCTVVNFTYDNSKIKGKKNPVWKLTKESDPDFDDIYYNNKYFSYMFTEKGSYTISLSLEDTNGNKQTVSKKEIIKII